MKFPIDMILLPLLCLAVAVNTHPTSSKIQQNLKGKCGYEGCPATPKNKLNIHLVPHTHDDVGWLKTIDQYYYGALPLIQKAGVEFILDSVVAELIKDPTKRFIYVESAFFFKWWPEQSKETQNNVIDLINEGRLEFIGGAWSMNDEATTHYQSLIDQFSHGLYKIRNTFGECGRPRVGWQIDPFGHSKEMASIFAGMGFDGMFFARLDWRNKGERLKNKAGEMIWNSSPSLGTDADLFTGILRNHYSAPPGFCFDYLCNDEPIIDDDGYERNVEKRLDNFYDYIQNMTENYATNNLMIPMGDDFNYQDASMYYKNMDKMIKHSKGRKVNEMEVNIFYSTPSCYLKSLNEANIKWPVEKNDFFPYATDIHTYWAGYFSSRPTSKRYERIGNNILQVCKKLSVTNDVLEESNENLDLLREAMGIMQHHDAITGTEKQHVADDYAYLLAKAIKGCDTEITKILAKHLKVNPEIHGNLEFEPCHKLNESSCSISEKSDSFMITLFNPLSHETYEFIRVPVYEGEYEIKDSKGNIVKNDIVPIPESIKKIPGRNSSAPNEMIFKAKMKDIASFYVQRKNTISKPQNESEILVSNKIVKYTPKEPKVDVENSKLKLTFVDGFLTSVEIKEDRKKFDLRQEFIYYEGAAGNNAPPFKNRSSGAYIFRPLVEQNITQKVNIKIYKSDQHVEIQQIFNDWISQVIRLYDNEHEIEFEWLVGPIPVADKIGKEIVSRFITKLNSGDIFYTDSNGREMVQRKLNKNDTEKEPIPANYYPITTKLAINDTTHRMAILTDRAQGGSCLKSGECEILVHRRLLHDDAFGVGEALNETTVARGRFYLSIGQNTPEIVARERQLQLKKLLAPWPVFSTLKNLDFNEWQKLNHEIASNVISAKLPQEINLMTFEPFGKDTILIRLENIYEKEAGGKEVQVNLKEFADRFNVASIEETTLDGNQLLKNTKRMQWQSNDGKNENSIVKDDKVPFSISIENIKKDLSVYEYTLKPMQIRTFIMAVKRG